MNNLPIQHLSKPMNDGCLLYAWFSAMHTRVDILLYGGCEEKQLNIVRLIYEELHRLEQLANFYNDSELFQVNRKAFRGPVKISQELFDMISFCLLAHERTLGYFDIAVHSDGYCTETIHSINLSSKDQAISFGIPGVKINLSGYLKGYAIEKIRGLLNKVGQRNALVNMGNSSVLAMGNHPYGEGWKVAFGNSVDLCNAENDIWLFNECLTTSGNDSEGRKHIIDPFTGQLIKGNRLVAVITDNGEEGEILSTALFAIGVKKQHILRKTFSPRWIQFLPAEKVIHGYESSDALN